MAQYCFAGSYQRETKFKTKKEGIFFPWVSSLPTGRVKGVEISPGLSLKKD